MSEFFEGSAQLFALKGKPCEVFEHTNPFAGAVGVGVDDPVQVVQNGSVDECLGENTRQ